MAFDPIVGGILVGILGLVLWIVTNIHLIRTGKAIKADIDTKRAATEKFVQNELSILKRGLQEDLGGDDPQAHLEAQLTTHLEALRADFKVELSDLESRLQTVQIDPAPLIAQIQAELIPAVQERVENVKSAILGSLGYAKKGVKALGEGVTKLVGENALEEAGITTEWEMRLAQFGLDDDWMKANKPAAFGLSLIKEALGYGKLRGGPDGGPLRALGAGSTKAKENLSPYG